ncbi:MAG: THUMP domain-containing protein [Candidatus Bathyarchaeota archaeon]
MDYNLLATAEQMTMSKACSQLWMNLRAVGDPEPQLDRSRIKGLILARTTMDPVEAIHKLREHMEAEPERYVNLYRVLPVQAWTTSSPDDIVDALAPMKGRVSPEESFRVTLEKRRTQLSSLEIIEPVADLFDRRVDLECPDWVVLVEVLGQDTGVSVVKPEDVLNVQKERAQSPA